MTTRSRRIRVPVDDRRIPVPNATMVVRKPLPSIPVEPPTTKVAVVPLIASRVRSLYAPVVGHKIPLAGDRAAAAWGAVTPLLARVASGVTRTLVTITDVARVTSTAVLGALSFRRTLAPAQIARTVLPLTPSLTRVVEGVETNPFPREGQSLMQLSDLKYLGCYAMGAGISGLSGGATKLTNVQVPALQQWEGKWIVIDDSGYFYVANVPEDLDPVPLQYQGSTLARDFPRVTLIKELGRICHGNYIRAPGDTLPIVPVIGFGKGTSTDPDSGTEYYNSVYWDELRQRLWVTHSARYGDPGLAPEAQGCNGTDCRINPGPRPYYDKDGNYATVCSLDFSTYVDGAVPPTLRGPWRYEGDNANPEEFPNYRCLHSNMQPAPDWLQSVLDARNAADEAAGLPMYYGEGPHWVMKAQDRNGMQDGSWGPGLVVGQIPKDALDTPGFRADRVADLGVNTSTWWNPNKVTPKGLGGEDYLWHVSTQPCLRARHLAFWPSLAIRWLDGRLDRNGKTRGRPVSFASCPSYWRVYNREGDPTDPTLGGPAMVWDKAHGNKSHARYADVVWDTIMDLRDQSHGTYSQFPSVRVTSQGRQFNPYMGVYSGDESEAENTSGATYRIPPDTAVYPDDGYGGAEIRIDGADHYPDMTPFAPDGAQHHGFYLFDTTTKLGLVIFRARCLGSRYYGGAEQYAAPYPGFIPPGDPGAPGDVTTTPEWEVINQTIPESGVVEMPTWIEKPPRRVVDPKDGTVKLFPEPPYYRVQITSNADSAVDGIQLQFLSTTYTDPANPILWGGLLSSEQLPFTYESARGRLQFVADAPDGYKGSGVVTHYRMRYVGPPGAQVTIRVWPVNTTYAQNGESSELFKSIYHPLNPLGNGGYVVNTLGGGRGFQEEYLTPTVTLIDGRDLWQSAKRISTPDRPIPTRVDVAEEARRDVVFTPQVEEEGVWSPVPGVHGDATGFFGYLACKLTNGVPDPAKRYGIIEHDVNSCYWDPVRHRFYEWTAYAMRDGNSSLQGVVNVYDTSALGDPPA